jgi:serine phosphatase RsbU (regulator of sigma subunit)
VAIENAHYHERNVAWVRLEHDLAAARAIQRSLLPQRMPDLPGYKLAVRSSACYEVGGDYADILRLPSGEVMMVVADVAGKGLASAIMSTAFRAAFRAMATSGLALSDIAVRLNQEHWGEGAEARLRYVTAIFLKLDAVAGRIEVVNAGHSPGFLIDGAGFRQIDACGPPLGILPGSQYTSDGFVFSPGARLLLYTDGLTDQLNARDEEYGADRLATDFLNSPVGGGKAILDQLWERVFRFADRVEQGDDMTALVLCRESGSGEAAAW